MNLSRLFATFFVALCCIFSCKNVANGQRNILHWKHDLEYRLNSYLFQRDKINDILSSSIYVPKGYANEQTRIFRAANVRFTDLIIAEGALVLDQHIARPTARILMNKTAGYVNSKLNELYQVKTQLDNIKRTITDQSQRFIFKGFPNAPTQTINFTTTPGIRVFKQMLYGRSISSQHVDLSQINFTNVDPVINATYMENLNLQLFDSKSRLYFEGKKTFWATEFRNDLKSGCCDRMRPLHTNRMMTRHTNQEVISPILFFNNGQQSRDMVRIHQLSTNLMYNRFLAIGFLGNNPSETVILPSISENYINLDSLIHIKQPSRFPEISKTLIFNDILMVEEATLYDTESGDNRLLVGLLSSPPQQFDLSHHDYLSQFMPKRNNSAIQYVLGRTIINSNSVFMKGLDSLNVNQVPDFRRFVMSNIIRVDQPGIIYGTIQFNALPTIFNSMGPMQIPQSVLIMMVDGGLDVGLINGMRLPQDILFLPPSPYALPSYLPIRILGPREFSQRLTLRDLVQVRKLVNGMLMPQEVIPLHLNDQIGSSWPSNLWFVDGINTHHLTIHSGQFHDIQIRDSDAQNILMRSVFQIQPDGSHLITAPLRIMNLRLLGQAPNQGLLNGFRPEFLLELSKRPFESIYGRKTFIAPVEADECSFSDINNIPNWQNQLIRIDRPQTLQTIHSELAFVQPPSIGPIVNSTPYSQPPAASKSASSVTIDDFRVEFYQDDWINHLNNWQFSPEFYIMNQALIKASSNNAGGRYRIINKIRIFDPSGGPGRVNDIALNDIVTLDQPFRFLEQMSFVGKVTVAGDLIANNIISNYPLDVMDLVQFNRYRIPIMGSTSPIMLNNLVLSTNNRAAFVQCRMLNGISFNEFAQSIMSLTRPQILDSSLVFTAPISFEGMVRTGSSLNNVNNFSRFASNLKSATYTFEDGVQCNSLQIETKS